jgi:2-hydroxychromene-2-carboxylate isomerase
MLKANYIEFYFDCSSPWTYLAFVEILSLSQRNDLEINWKPVLVGGVFNTVNQDVYEFRKKPNPLKLKYSKDDLNLWSKVREISINFPKVFPVNSVKAMRGCLFAIKENKLEEFADNLFKAYWSRGVDISQEDLLLDIAIVSNLDSTDFKKFIHSQKAKESLQNNTEELIKRGGFGSPTFFYNNYMFFGNDRLLLFEESFQRGLLD